MDVTVPLRGYVVSSDPYAREMLTELPSPCGDMLFHRWGGPNVVVTTLPSPRGDKLFHGVIIWCVGMVVTVPSRG